MLWCKVKAIGPYAKAFVFDAAIMGLSPSPIFFVARLSSLSELAFLSDNCHIKATRTKKTFKKNKKNKTKMGKRASRLKTLLGLCGGTGGRACNPYTEVLVFNTAVTDSSSSPTTIAPCLPFLLQPAFLTDCSQIKGKGDDTTHKKAKAPPDQNTTACVILKTFSNIL